MTYNPRSSGHDYDWDTMTQEDAIEIVIERLADLYEAMAKDFEDERQNLPTRPVRPEGVPPHVIMVKWMPILADYEMFARRANKASIRADEAVEKLAKEEAKLHKENRDYERKANSAIHTLRQAKNSLRQALEYIEKHNDDVNKDE